MLHNGGAVRKGALLHPEGQGRPGGVEGPAVRGKER